LDFVACAENNFLLDALLEELVGEKKRFVCQVLQIPTFFRSVLARSLDVRNERHIVLHESLLGTEAVCQRLLL
jgi:hypothetical protein